MESNNQKSKNSQTKCRSSTTGVIAALLGVVVILFIASYAMKGRKNDVAVNINQTDDQGFGANILDTSKWERFRIPINGLDVRYPDEFVVTEANEDYVTFALKQEDDVEAVNIFSVSVVRNPNMLAMNEWFLQSEQYMSKEEFDGVLKRKNRGGVELTEENIVINEFPVIVQRERQEGADYLTVFVPRADYVVVLNTYFHAGVYGSPDNKSESEIVYTDTGKGSQLRYLKEELMEEIFFQVVKELK